MRITGRDMAMCASTMAELPNSCKPGGACPVPATGLGAAPAAA